MNGKENIINKILSDADAKCEKILEQANAEAQSIVAAADVAIARDKADLDERIAASTAERIRNRVATAELEGKKYRLNKKQQLISRCYDVAYEQLLKQSDKERLALIASLLDKHAEKGETVYICEKDSKLVTQKFLDGFNKGLKLGKKYVNTDGGVVLEGDGYEKDLTLRTIIRYSREQTEAKVAEKLLGVTHE